jgi:glycosyltransferase involved in cell wall biosynthesis
MFVRPLAGLGVEVGYLLPSIVADGPLDRRGFERQVEDGVERLRAAADRADVVVFRRAYASHIVCLQCAFATLDGDAGIAHAATTGHAVNVGADLAVRRFFDGLDSEHAARGAIVYETDDDLLRVDPANGQHRIAHLERDLIERMIRRADLVTTSTPALASRLTPLAAAVRVLRNAVDPGWYGAPRARPGGRDPDRPRVGFYGSVGRLRDYAVCATAVDAVVRRHRGARRVWIGAPAAGPDDLRAEVDRAGRVFDEVHPYVAGVPGFARQLAALDLGIGLAPLTGGPFDRCKSELHWLEYAMAGAATVATRLRGGGPYDVISHGVDGLLAGSVPEWRRALERLVESSALRAEIAGRARERVLAEYSVDGRAAEWADAYRDAAEQAGRGLVARVRRASPRRHAGSARPAGTGSRPMPKPEPAPARPVPATPTPAAIVAAYLAAQAYAGRSPLRLRLGIDGSAAAPAPPNRGLAGDGWVTIDTAGTPDIRHHVGYGLPFADGSVDRVEATEVLDRLGELGPILIAEIARVLRPGGRVRLCTPDRRAALARQAVLAIQGVTVSGTAGRLPRYTAETLERSVTRAGFGIVRCVAAPTDQLILEARR